METGYVTVSGGGGGSGGMFAPLLAEHLGGGAESLPIVSRAWPLHELVNVQGGIDHWLAESGFEYRLLGVAGFRHRMFGLGDLLQPGIDHGMRVGGAAMVERPSGPGETRSCVQCGIYLLSGEGTPPMVLLLNESPPQQSVIVEIATADQDAARGVLERIRELVSQHSVYLRQVISLGGEVLGPRGGSPIVFHERPGVSADQLVLPPGLLEGVERQILGVARHRDLLTAHGQHLKRGILLYGPPGAGKTHTVRYLISMLTDTTVLILSGDALQYIAPACSIARSLQPCMVVVEDVDLIASERQPGPAQHGLLFQLLNEMDGLEDDIDVTFVLTTNREDALEPALASRPGRIDHAVEIPLPDADGRRRLIELYKGGLDLRLTDPELVVERTDGVTAAFIKELLRRAALYAADERDSDGDGTLRVTDAHVNAALDVLLDSRHRLTRRLLGSAAPD